MRTSEMHRFVQSSFVNKIQLSGCNMKFSFKLKIFYKILYFFAFCSDVILSSVKCILGSFLRCLLKAVPVDIRNLQGLPNLECIESMPKTVRQIREINKTIDVPVLWSSLQIKLKKNSLNFPCFPELSTHHP